MLPLSLSLSVYILIVLPLWNINFYMSTFDWLRINNKSSFQVANRLAQQIFQIVYKKKKKTKLELMKLSWFLS